jgi:hypothetical protein
VLMFFPITFFQTETARFKFSLMVFFFLFLSGWYIPYALCYMYIILPELQCPSAGCTGQFVYFLLLYLTGSFYYVLGLFDQSTYITSLLVVVFELHCILLSVFWRVKYEKLIIRL